MGKFTLFCTKDAIMKQISRNLLYLMLLIFGLNSCEDKCYYYEEQTVFEEVLQPLADIKSSYRVTEDFAIVKPGNIYSYGQYLLVGEKFRGIHILDNSNPSNPVKIKFIELKGNENFAVVNDMLLADNGPDLLSIDISNMSDIQLKKRSENVNMFNVRGDKFVSGYNKLTKKVKINCENQRFGMRSESNLSSASSGSGSSTGKGGSMAKFAIIDNYLYIVNSNELLPLDISNPASPLKKNNIGLSNGNVETVFPYKKYLYMGTSSGVLIYDCSISKEAPNYISTLEHVQGCDPVVVSDDMAFSTVRGGTACRNNNLNELNIFNVTNPSQATQVGRYTMQEPYGLGVNSNLLFICQGTHGLFVYNWDNSSKQVTLRHSYPDIHAFDVIVNGNLLIVTADNGLFQFDITNPDNITYLSKLVNF
jgi:hypothetical protein